MSRHIKLIPDLQQLIDDFVSVRQRFADLVEAYVKQKIQLEKQQAEIENGKKEILSMRQTQIDENHLSKSFDQLKRDYDLLYSSSEKQREEIRKDNDTRFRELEEQLKAERVKLVEQAEANKKNMNRVILDYESRLRDADEKIKRLSIRSENYETSVGVKKSIYESDDNEDSPASKKAKREVNRKWPALPLVRYDAKSSVGGRGRGRPRGAGAKRKLYVAKIEAPVDIV